MLIAIGLLIVAILLFGSSAVLGALSAILGFLCLLFGSSILVGLVATSMGWSIWASVGAIAACIALLLCALALFFTFFDHTIGRGWHRK